MKIPLPALVLGASVCFGLGYLVAPAFSPSGPGDGRRIPPDSKSPGSKADQISGMLEKIRTDRDPVAARRSLLDLVESAGSGDLERIFSEAELVNDDAARDAAAQRWAELDPAGFCGYLKRLPFDEMGELTDTANLLFRTWGRLSPGEAIAEATQLENLPGFSRVRGAVAVGVMRDNPEKAFALIAAAREVSMGIAHIDRSVWEKDPVRFAKAIAAAPLQNVNSQNNYILVPFRDALSAWAERDFSGSLEWARTLDPEIRFSVLPTLLAKIAEKDLSQARSAFESLEPSLAREAVGTAIVSRWAKTDPRAAYEWIETAIAGGRG